MNNLVLLIGAGYVIVIMVLIILSVKVMDDERIGLGWRNIFLTLLGISAFLALTTVMWIASNLTNWVQ
ncbi:MAG: hypothetical protein P8100_11170 [bacterium]|jgi:hypothetical protein